MERQNSILICSAKASIPSVEYILTIPREIKLKIVFEGHMREYREFIGKLWKRKLPDFSVGIHQIDPEINIAKLITRKEISDHQLFFEQCARDYHRLAAQLIHELASYLHERIDPVNPMNAFGKYYRRNQKGAVGQWNYFLHGSHCGFKHQKTNQYVEVSLTRGLEYGSLDPYFFSRYILSSQVYYPLPVAIYEDYLDGQAILNEMVALGRFEIISAGVLQDKCIVVARDR